MSPEDGGKGPIPVSITCWKRDPTRIIPGLHFHVNDPSAHMQLQEVDQDSCKCASLLLYTAWPSELTIELPWLSLETDQLGPDAPKSESPISLKDALWMVKL